jgi:signal transduction histidine kinase/ActR/RegA family two-component response regulator
MKQEPEAPPRRLGRGSRRGVPSIAFHRTLLVAAIVVPALLCVGAAMARWTDVQREATDTTVRTAAILHEHARKVFETHDLLLGRIDERLRGLGWDEIADPRWSAYLRALNAPLPQTVSIWVTGPDGVVRAGSRPFDPGGSIKEREFFKAQADADQGLYVSAPFVGKATKTHSFAISRRRSSNDGSFDGIIHVAVSPEYFTRFFAEASPEVAHGATLFRTDGTILAREPVAAIDGKLDPGSPLMTAISSSTDRGVLTSRSPIDGKERIIAYRHVEGYPVYVAFGIDIEGVVAIWRRDAMTYAVTAGVASFVLLLVSWLALRRADALRVALDELAHEAEERATIEDRLRQSQKMDAIGQLTGGIAHDFNNILTTIIGNLVAIRRGLGPGREALDNQVSAALSSAERAATLTRRLLAFARQQPLSPRSVDVGLLVADLMELIRGSVGEAIEVRYEEAGALWPARCDPNGLENVLLNLVVNARDAMPDGGHLTLSAANITLDRGMAETLGVAPGDYVRIAAVDDGRGMNAETLARAFEPFYTTKPLGQGTGLGLSQAYGYAQQSRGALRLTSEEGRGTRAELFLPRGDAVELTAPLRASAPDAAAARPDGPRAHVLLVEDEPLVRLVMAEALAAAGLEVHEAEDARAALDLVAAGARVDVLVSDIGLPHGMNGRQLAEAMRAERPDLPIVLATGYARDLVSGEIAMAGVQVIEKPFTPDDLAARVLAVVRQPVAAA